jgi:hypothetical protein
VHNVIALIDGSEHLEGRNFQHVFRRVEEGIAFFRTHGMRVQNLDGSVEVREIEHRDVEAIMIPLALDRALTKCLQALARELHESFCGAVLAVLLNAPLAQT